MMDVDSRQLAVFRAVAQQGSFTGAGAALHTVQSAVSATVAALEAELGARLFDRTTRRVTLTPAGRALLPAAGQVAHALQAARDAVDAVRGGLTGSVRIGYMTNVTLFDIPALLGRFRAQHPGVDLQLSPAATGTAGLADGLRRGDLDLAFLAATPPEHPDLVVEVLASSPLGLAVATGDPLAARSATTLAEAVQRRFVDFGEGFTTRTLVDAELRRRGLRRRVDVQTSDINDIAALVRNGLGAAFLPAYLVAGDPSVAWLAIEDAHLELHVSLATARGRSTNAAAGHLAALARTRSDQLSPGR